MNVIVILVMIVAVTGSNAIPVMRENGNGIDMRIGTGARIGSGRGLEIGIGNKFGAAIGKGRGRGRRMGTMNMRVRKGGKRTANRGTTVTAINSNPHGQAAPGLCRVEIKTNGKTLPP